MTKDINFYLDQLDLCSTREEGHELLKKEKLKILNQIAGKIFIDGRNKQDLLNKIIERRIGLRLRQDAFASII